SISGDEITISVEDFGRGIKDVERAMEPLYTSKPELERSGMGFTVMETFMDSLEVKSEEGKGTKVVMKKKFNIVS
ncbi:anti-sigma F factor, partial [Clostridium perfringens]